MEILLELVLPLFVLGGIVVWILSLVTPTVGREPRSVREPERLLRWQRRGETFETFREGINGVQVPDRILRAVYNRLSNGTFWRRGFPVRATDSLRDVYGIGDPGNPDVDLLIRDIAAQCGLNVVPSESHWARPVTAGALAVYLAAIQAESAAKHASEVLLRSADGSADERESLLRPVAESSTDSSSDLLRPCDER
jgi:hypothetical protein